MQLRKPPKIKDVANAAGVSTATVSRTLSNPETVAESTRKAVLEAATTIGYRVNLSAQNLRRRRTNSVVVLVPNLGNPFFSEILAGIEKALTQAGLSVFLIDTAHADTESHRVLDYLHNSRTDGIISLDGNLPLSWLEPDEFGESLPPIVFACEWTRSSCQSGIRADNEGGVTQAVQHLVDLGHKQIGLICGPQDNILTIVRHKATMKAIKNLSARTSDAWTFAGDFSLDAGVAAARDWIALKKRPTAMICANDEIAFGFISELDRNSISVPDEVSVVGFDDIDISRHFIPSLTTIRQPRMSIGTAAADMLLTTIANKEIGKTPKTITMPVELIIRNSTAKPR